MSIFEDQRRFMLAGQQEVTYNPDQIKLYEKLIDEEYWEFRDALRTEPLENQLKECTDLLVVLSGWLISQGINAQSLWDIVHANNMAKVSEPPKKDANGKILKSPKSIERKEIMMREIRNLF